MSRLTEREIARRLAEPLQEEPPAGLLEKIKSEIPPVVPVGIPEGKVRPFPVPSPEPRRQRWLIAASLATAVLGGLLAWQVLWIRPKLAATEEVPVPDEVVEQTRSDAPEGALPMPPPPPPPPAAAAPPPTGEADASRVTELKEELQELGYSSGGRNEELRLRRQSAPVQPMEVPQAAPEPAYDFEGGVEGGVVGGVPGGVVGGVVGGEVAEPPMRVGAGGHEKPASPKVKTGTTGGSTGGNTEPNDEAYGDTFFRSAGTNPFVDTEEDRLSTFGLDVDTASYTVARRYLEDGNLPDPDSVRVEELVNFFDYGDPAPARDDFALKAEGAPTPFAGPGYRLLRFNIKARQIRPEDRKPAEAGRVLVEEPEGTLETVARDAKAQVQFNPEVVASWRLLGYENRDIADEKFRDDSVDAGEIGAGHSVTALYEVKLKPGATADRPVANLHLRWRSEKTGRVREEEELLRVSQLAGSWESATPALRLASVVAEFAEILRGSYWARGSSLDDLYRLAQRVAAEQGESRRASDVNELMSLIAKAARLQKR